MVYLRLPYIHVPIDETSPFRGSLPIPPFYYQHLATKPGMLADSFLPCMFQLRPEDMVFGNNPLLYAKHLKLLSHLSDSSLCRQIPPYDVSPSLDVIPQIATWNRTIDSSQ